jgi:hypothetical protein
MCQLTSIPRAGILTLCGDKAFSSIDIDRIIAKGIMFVERENNTLVLTTLFHHDGTVSITVYDDLALPFIKLNDRVRLVQHPDGTPILVPISCR